MFVLQNHAHIMEIYYVAYQHYKFRSYLKVMKDFKILVERAIQNQITHLKLNAP